MNVGRQRVWMGRGLYLFAAWTLAIKFVLPFAWALHRQEPLLTYVWWDAWWVAHLLVGYGLIHLTPHIWRWALVLAIVETLIIGTKFALFLPHPTWDFWHANWFVNKSFMLAYFVFSLFWLVRPATRVELQGDVPSSAKAGGDERGE